MTFFTLAPCCKKARCPSSRARPPSCDRPAVCPWSARSRERACSRTAPPATASPYRSRTVSGRQTCLTPYTASYNSFKSTIPSGPGTFRFLSYCSGKIPDSSSPHRSESSPLSRPGRRSRYESKESSLTYRLLFPTYTPHDLQQFSFVINYNNLYHRSYLPISYSLTSHSNLCVCYKT